MTRPPTTDPAPGAEALIDAADAVILWDETDGGIAHVSVARMPALRVAADHPAWALWRALAGQWDYAFGAISPLWLSSETARPESVFAYFVMADFATEAEEVRAWAAFSRIRECGWARREPEGAGPPAGEPAEAPRGAARRPAIAALAGPAAEG